MLANEDQLKANIKFTVNFKILEKSGPNNDVPVCKSLQQFVERLKIDGRLVSDEDIMDNGDDMIR